MTLSHPRRARGLLREIASTARIWFALWPRRSPRPQAGVDREGRAVSVDAAASLRRGEELRGIAAASPLALAEIERIEARAQFQRRRLGRS